MSGDVSSDYWRGKRAVVTGGSQGLGYAVAQLLTENGAQVILAARNPAALDDAVVRLDCHGAFPCDVLQDEPVAALVQHAATELGGIDIWVNAAGKSSRGAVLDTSLEEFRELWELNFLATARCSLAAAPQLCAAQGHLVNIGSLACKFAPRWLGAYPTSKFPLAAFCQQLRLEQAEQNLHVLLVCPGPLHRIDAGQRYGEKAKDLPSAAAQPGGGAKVKLLDPNDVAVRLLRACERRQPELVLPAKARLLAAISQWSPGWGDWLLRRSSS